MKKKTNNTNMEEAYCSFEVSELLKEKGFDEKFYFFYRTDDDVKNIHHAVIAQPLEYSKKIDDEVIAAPTHQMACAWLRKKKGIAILPEIHAVYTKGYHWAACIYKLDNPSELHTYLNALDSYTCRIILHGRT